MVVVYVDDITFSSDPNLLTNEFAVDMKAKFEMSMHEEISYFLRFHIM